MARKETEGLDYTWLDLDFFQDRKVRRLRRRCGSVAPLVYIAILCTIYKERYYIVWDDDVLLDIADMTGLEEKYIGDVINSCLEVGLFSKEMFEKEGILTSVGIQKQYSFIINKGKRLAKIGKYNLISSEGMGINPEEMGINSEEMQKNDAENAISSEEMRRIEYNSILYNNKENNILSIISPCGEDDEKERERILYNFFFTKNFPQAESEATEFLNHYADEWLKMSTNKRTRAINAWRQIPEQGNGMGDNELLLWKNVYESICKSGAPFIVRMSAMADGIRLEKAGESINITCPKALSDYIEKADETRFAVIHPALKKLMQSFRCSKLYYVQCAP